ncbi:oligosaccharide flippase family protein [Shewanella frigidimarina]|uniref:Polysaccharide biosynthesis protein n=1 Tax=Shewanella frigidimarina (strain NCIMB 400) TaxID=318167 RepID=Q07Z91_SHEFN|nr:oligosaccharide flippase family protein [Shewanella frigidimarina]ABI72673.1 polysaccharide biosynthesis protein [Shewanella frigidimarina NCIMB 400]
MLANLIKYAVSEGIAKLAPFFTTLYVAKYLSVEDFGRYSLIFVVYELFFILISFNIQATTRIDFFKLNRVRFLATKREHLIICLLLALFLLTASIFASSGYTYVLTLLVLASFLRCISVFQLAIYQCEKSASRYVASNIVFTVSLSLFTLVFVALDYGYLSWLYGLLFASFLQVLISCILFGHIRTLLFLSFHRLTFRFDSFKATFIIALLFLPQALGWWLKLGADRWIIERQVGTAVLGQYSLAFQFSSALLIAASVINLVLVPEINTCLKSSNYKRIKLFLIPAILFLILLSVVIYFVASEFILRVYDAEYFNSVLYLKLLIFPFLIQSFILILSNVLYYWGKGGYMAKVILAAFSLQVIVNFFFVEIFGVVGMVLVSLIANIMVLLLIILKSKKELALRIGG